MQLPDWWQRCGTELSVYRSTLVMMSQLRSEDAGIWLTSPSPSKSSRKFVACAGDGRAEADANIAASAIAPRHASRCPERQARGVAASAPPHHALERVMPSAI